MKMTKTKAQAALKAFKSGLSMILAFVLLGNMTQPAPALAASHVESLLAPQAVSATMAAAAPEAPSTVQDVLLQVCQDQGFDETCAKHLMGILMQESVGKANAVGDHGMARGWFQINRYYNPDVSVACAEELTCSATWTLNHMVKKGYPQTVKWAIWCHNGCGISKTYVNNVLRKGEANWSEPLPVVTADEQRAIALK
jgi:hypothetical protein